MLVSCNSGLIVAKHMVYRSSIEIMIKPIVNNFIAFKHLLLQM